MKSKKPVFNTKQREIIRALNKTRIGLTPYGISQRTGISWTTVKKHVRNLERRDIIMCKKIPTTSKKLCKLNFALIYGKR